MNFSKIKSLVLGIWPLIFLSAVVFLFFWKFFFKGLIPIPADTIVGMYHPWRDVVWDNFTAGIPFKNFLITDPVRQQIPWRKLVIDFFKEGNLPLWNPYSFAGTPLLANFQSAPFYIFNFLFFLLDFKVAWGILIFLQPLLAGFFLYFYLRELKLEKAACFLGALAFSFSGFFIAWLCWGTLVHAALWLPLILLTIEKILARAKIKFDKNLVFWSFVFVFSLVQSFFAGHLQTSFYVFLFSLIYLLWKIFSLKRGKLKAFFLYLILYTLYFILTSIQWIPTLQFIKLSARSLDRFDWQAPGWFLPWQHLVQFLAPDFFGNPATLNYWGVWNYAEFVGFIGVIPLLFVFWAIFKRRDKSTLFFSTFCLISLSFALPTFWAKLPYKWQLPFFSTSQPTRILSLVCFCLAVLAALGLDSFLKKKRRRLASLVPLMIFAFLWLFVFSAGKIWPQKTWIVNLAVAKRNLILPTAMVLAGTILFWLMSFLKKGFLANLALFLIFLFSLFDLFRFGFKFTPFVKKAWFFPETETIKFLQEDESVFRIMAVDRRILPPNFGMVYGLQDVAGYDPLYLARYAELMAASERGKPDISPPFGFNRMITPQNYNSRIADLLGVKYVLSLTDLESPKLDLVFREGETRVYENQEVFPRAFMVYDYRLTQGKNEAISLLFDRGLDFKQTVVLEEEPQGAKFEKGEGKVKIEEYEEEKVVISVETDRPGILVLTDTYYPSWEAQVNGGSTKIYRANYAFRAIVVPAGKSQVVFEFSLDF